MASLRTSFRSAMRNLTASVNGKRTSANWRFRRLDLDERIRGCDYSVRRAEESIDSAKADAASLERQLQAAEVKEIAVKARSRQAAVTAVIGALQELLAIREQDMRLRLDKMIKEMFLEITMKPYVPELFGDFELGLFKVVNGERLPVQKSTGENQILSLSFVAAVSRLAREVRSERDTEFSSSGDAGEYPIVMDAAFGSLDQNYQRDVTGRSQVWHLRWLCWFRRVRVWARLPTSSGIESAGRVSLSRTQQARTVGSLSSFTFDGRIPYFFVEARHGRSFERWNRHDRW